MSEGALHSDVTKSAASRWLKRRQGVWTKAHLSDQEIRWVAREWLMTAHMPQLPPRDLADTWLVIGGRGAGKTRLGAEWVNGLVRGLAPFSLSRYGRIALIGETYSDVREVMIGGPSGIASIARHDRPRYEVTRRRLLWSNGAVAQVFSAECPDRLRGPQFEAIWADEAGKWRLAEECFDTLQFGLRLGPRPLQLITTTPKPTRLIRRLVEDPAVTVTWMRTADNAANLAEGFVRAIRQRYGGTRIGRQEIDGELLFDRDDGLWSRPMLEKAQIIGRCPPVGRIVVAVDPPASSKRGSNSCGIVAAGLDDRGRAVVLADDSVAGLKPAGWAARAIDLYHTLGADCLVAEVNQGGDMVQSVIGSVDKTVPVRSVRAKRGKWLRAEPVATLYEQGQVRHACRMPELEDEMCDFGPNGLSNGRSPDRLDALVWAITELLLRRKSVPRIRDFT